MPSPEVRYCTTEDGVRIAYWAMGAGKPLLLLPLIPWSHLQMEWGSDAIRSWYQRLLFNRMLVRYDGRGTGLSDRDAKDLSLAALVSDIEAVADSLELATFSLIGFVGSGRVAITYAARHPERVSGLLLWCAYARGTDWRQSAQAETLVTLTDALLEQDWDTYTQTRARLVVGWSEQEAALDLAALMRESVTPHVFRAFSDALDNVDVTDLLHTLKAPTLVLHRREVTHPRIEAAKGLASTIPNARLALLEGASALPWLGETQAVVAAIDEFEGVAASGLLFHSPAEAATLRTVLFTDIVGHTEMMQRLGDDAGRAVLREHERIIRDVLRVHDGAEVKTMGDGFMASFASVTKAVECAIALQRAFDRWNRGEGAGGRDPRPATPDPVHIRVGLNAGEPIAEDGDLFGSTVILASRIAAQAGPGEVLVPDTVRGLCSGKGFLFADRGDVALRGFEDPVRLYEVRWRE